MFEVFASFGFALLVVCLVLAAFGMVVGFHFGNELGSRLTSSREFWKYNGICYAIVVVLTAFFIALNLPTLIFVCVGGLGGFIAGIRMGYGESVGPWRAHDRFYTPHKNKKKRASVSRDGGAEVQHPRAKERELISTQTTDDK